MGIMEDADPVPERPTAAAAGTSPLAFDGVYLCVLASGSAGNCSVLARRREGVTRLTLIDLGLSPRKTYALLAGLGLRPDQIDDCLVTHLDGDHLQQGWRRQLPAHARVRMHQRHAMAARMWGWLDDPWRVQPFEADFDLDAGVRVRPLMMPHDDLGVASFRVDIEDSLGGSRPASLGYATDLGRVHTGLLEHFGGLNPVDVLAIESNYCPVMQRQSARPDSLKQRIMGGNGHLSNQEALSAILQIDPREHVVLLHLSRDCNSREIVSSLHAGADYAVTIASQGAPTRWVRVGGHPRVGLDLEPKCRQARSGPGRVTVETLWTSMGA